MSQEIKLPPLPKDMLHTILKLCDEYATAAVELDRAQRGEPVAIYNGRCVIDCGDNGHHDIEVLKMIPCGAKLYTAPQPAHTEAEVQELVAAFLKCSTNGEFREEARRILGVKP